MKERQYLHKDQTLLLRGKSDSSGSHRKFTIGKRISEGAFAVCYEAYYAGSGYGVLKEFYPEDAYMLERDASGQLVLTEGLRKEWDQFHKDEEAYIKPYEMLLDLKQNGDNQDLATFIPAFEIYQGCDKEGNFIGSIYIWTPEPKLETFDKICHDIQKNPSKDPEKKLVLVLNAIKSLTECICILHGKGIIHRDIKPSNFGFKKRGDEILYQTIALIDVNSICSVYSKEKDLVETRGYLEPEGKMKEATNQTDIYAIGVTLFSAVVITDETSEHGFIYQQDEYDKIHELVKNSRLITASERNSHPRLVSVLTTILQKSLCSRRHRYENCEQMLEDLETVLFYALPTEIALKQRAGQKWVLKDVEKSFHADRDKNAALSTRYHLYTYPLYQCVRKEDPVIDVLVIGFGNYGQKFLDVCLQAGQSRDKGLNVVVLSDDRTDKDIYLEDRADLPKFFNIDGSLDKELKEGTLTEQDVYGDILFVTRRLQRDDLKENTKILREVMNDYQVKKQQPNYVYIALGNDELNAAAADACKQAVDAFGWDCLVNYVCENEKFYKKCSAGKNKIPFYINADIKKMDLYPQVERMAFNTHLIWEKDLDIDYQVIRENFLKPYNHDSSVSNVLSIKYKLQSVGIDLEPVGYNTKAAKEFQDLITSPENKKIRDELIWAEHRRWVTEKLCQGWRRKEVIDCRDGLTRDEEQKKHVCIVRSRPGQDLAKKWDRARWDDLKDKEDLKGLDELDRMSVSLHRFYVKEAKRMKKQGLLAAHGGILNEIRSLTEESKEAVYAYQEWFACLKDIWDGETQKVNLYEGFKNSLLKEAEVLPAEKRKALLYQMQAFDLEFRPILESIRYRDWKQDDAALVDSIPFILTYDENLHMVIPYATGSNTAVFGNVAAATVANPKKITYLCYIADERDVDKFGQSIPGVLAYTEKKKIRARIHFLLLYEDSLQNKNLKEKFQTKTGIKAGNIQCVMGSTKEELPGKLREALMQKAAKENFFLATEKNETPFSSYLDGAGFYKDFSCYTFDAGAIEFKYTHDCDMLDYIRKEPYITVAEILALSGSYIENHEQPEFFDDYEDLWKRYSEDKDAWKILCRSLKRYADQNDVLVTFPVKEEQAEKGSGKAVCYEYILPFACEKNAAGILEFLKEQNIVEGYGVQGYTSESCKIFIHGRGGYLENYDTLFSHVMELMIPDAVVVYRQGMEIRVTFNDLTVTEVPVIDNDKNKKNAVTALAEYLYEKGYLINLKNEDGKLSFTYATRQIKELLTKEGKMLEVYVYHKAKEQGDFDDVVSGYEFHWEQEGVRNESDCILTKGFQTLFVECKARSRIDQEFYYKLRTMTEKIGVHAKAVLIADTEDTSTGTAAENNAMQRRRGEGLDIITIWKEKEIKNIGETLMKIMDKAVDNTSD